VRSLVLILMIVLLPIRVWAAEGMSIRMASHPAALSALITESMDAMVDMPEDCPMRASAQQDEPSDSQTPATAACMACQLCAAVTDQPEFRAAGDAPPALLAWSMSSSFDSADPLRELKPPIS
jgi:hypothetical protein